MHQRLNSGDDAVNGHSPSRGMSLIANGGRDAAALGGHGASYNFKFNAGDVNAYFSVLLDNIANISAYVS
jgi:hypothetical protein